MTADDSNPDGLGSLEPDTSEVMPPAPPRMRAQVTQTFAGSMVLMAIGLLTGILAARAFGPVGNGELTTIRTWAGLLMGMANLGLFTALTYHASKQPKAAGSWWKTASLLVVASTFVALGIGALMLPWLLRDQPPVVVWSTVFFLLVGPMDALLWSGLNALRATNRFALWNILRVLSTLNWLLVLVAAALIGGISATRASNISVITLGLFGIVVFFICRRMIGPPRNFDRSKVRPLFTFGLPAVAAALPQTLNARADLLVVTAVLTSGLSGLYSVAGSAAAVVGPVAASIGAVVFPRVAQTVTAGGQRAMVVSSTRISIIPTFGMVLALTLTVPLLIPLIYGQQYRPAVPSAIILIVGAGIAAYNGVLGEGLRGLGTQKGLIIGNVLGMVVTGVACLIAIPILTIELAAVFAAVGNLATTAVLLWFAARLCDSPWLRFTLPLLPRFSWPRRKAR